MRPWVLIGAIALALAGCGEPDYKKYKGAKGNAYDLEHKACSSYPPEKLAYALELQVDTNTREGLVQIAQKRASRYRQGPLRQAAYEGCLDALPKRS